MYCKPCLDREQKLYKGGSRSGHISKVKKYSPGTSTSSMNDHLLNAHGIEMKDSDKLQRTLAGYFSPLGASAKSGVAAKTAVEYNRDMVTPVSHSSDTPVTQEGLLCGPPP